MASKKVVRGFIVFLIAYLIVSLALLLLGFIDPVVFWVILLFVAIFAFVLLPRIRPVKGV